MPHRWMAPNWSLLPSEITGSLAGRVLRSLASAASKSSKVFSDAGSMPACRSFAMLANKPVEHAQALELEQLRARGDAEGLGLVDRGRPHRGGQHARGGLEAPRAAEF